MTASVSTQIRMERIQNLHLERYCYAKPPGIVEYNRHNTNKTLLTLSWFTI
jgi:hypothetical protein